MQVVGKESGPKRNASVADGDTAGGAADIAAAHALKADIAETMARYRVR